MIPETHIPSQYQDVNLNFLQKQNCGMWKYGACFPGPGHVLNINKPEHIRRLSSANCRIEDIMALGSRGKKWNLYIS